MIQTDPAVSEITRKERSEERNHLHFTDEGNFYKFVWIFLLGSALGFIAETLFMYFIMGIYEWRSSMLHIPFNIMYGIGACVLHVVLQRIDNKRILHIFLFSAAAGTVVELVCGLIQENVLGSSSWDYSHLPLNIAGRVCLIFTFLWGILGIIWIRMIYPLLDRVIRTIPNTYGKALTWLLFILFIIDGFLSIMAILRWIMRIQKLPAGGIWGTILDRFFPDSYMEFIYSNMEFIKK